MNTTRKGRPMAHRREPDPAPRGRRVGAWLAGAVLVAAVALAVVVVVRVLG